MRKRFKRLKKTLQALNVDLGDDDQETLEEIQAGMFLIQLMSQSETGHLDLSGQTGYFFKWHDGPHAPSLNEAYRDLINYMRFENATNGYEIDTPSLAAHAIKLDRNIDVPSEIPRAEWLRMLAVVAYLRAAGWNTKPAKKEAESIFPDKVDDYFTKAENQIEDLGLSIDSAPAHA